MSQNTLESESKNDVQRPTFFYIKNLLISLIHYIGLDFLILIFMSYLLITLVASLHGEIRWLHPSMGFPLIIVVAVLLLEFVKCLRSPTLTVPEKLQKFSYRLPIVLRDWTPFILINFIYENLHDLSASLGLFDITDWLYRVDLRLFGVEPTLWMQNITSVRLTDIMAILYAPYLAYPLILMSLCSLFEDRQNFRKISLAVIFTFLFGFTCYVIFPALPPRFYLEALYVNPVSLDGSYIHDHLQGVWDKLSAVRGAAFPSLHTAISSVALYYVFQLRRQRKIYLVLSYLYPPFIFGLWFSTVYLRHHWIPDLLAGWTIAMLSIYVSKKLSLLQDKVGDHHLSSKGLAESIP